MGNDFLYRYPDDILTVADPPQQLRQAMSSLEYLYGRMIDEVFDHLFGGSWRASQAMRIDFRGLYTTDGPHTSLLLWRPDNYVGVYTLSVPVSELRRDGYHAWRSTPEAYDWKLVCRHDSCWRDSVHHFIRHNIKQLEGYVYKPFEIVNLTPRTQRFLKLLADAGQGCASDRARAELEEIKKGAVDGLRE